MERGNTEELFTCITRVKGCQRKFLATQNKPMHTQAKLHRGAYWHRRLWVPQAFMWATRREVVCGGK